MNKKVLLSAISLAIGTMLSQSAWSHGAVSYPVSRQYQCYKEGGFWGEINAVPNAGCRAAVAASSQYPLIQWNEVAANPSPRHDPAAIKKAVPNGLLCAAGDEKKAGLDAPQSAGWKLTPVNAGKMELTWDATAPHNPATYKVYITKAGADYQNRALKWDDLEEIASGEMPPAIKTSSPAQYKIPVTIPAGRSGKAMLYSVWQRNDAGNEGFFNCSDILIQGGDHEEDVAPAEENWIEEQPFIKPGFAAPEIGESVRFRLLGGNGSRGLEVVDVTIPVTAQNQSNYRWAEELAAQLNKSQSHYVSVGVKENDQIQFNPAERHIFENRVWVKDTQYSSAMTIIAAKDPDQDSGIVHPDVQTWPAGIGSYKVGKTVVKGADGNLWRCRPYPQGGWCNINHPAYQPGGAGMIADEDMQPWERVK